MKKKLVSRMAGFLKQKIYQGTIKLWENKNYKIIFFFYHSVDHFQVNLILC